MTGIALTRRGAPDIRRHLGPGRVNVLPRWESTGPGLREQRTARAPRGRQTEREPTPVLRIFAPNSRKSRKHNIESARRLLAAKLT
jgi:hypothetical protein